MSEYTVNPPHRMTVECDGYEVEVKVTYYVPNRPAQCGNPPEYGDIDYDSKPVFDGDGTPVHIDDNRLAEEVFASYEAYLDSLPDQWADDNERDPEDD